MSAFNSEKFITVTLPDLAPVAADVVTHFQERGYDTATLAGQDGGYEVSITKGGMFKKVVGLRTALKIEIMPQQPSGTLVRAGVGIFGKQAIPFVIAMAVTWVVLLPQIWGLINQAGLDDEAVTVAELSLNRLSRLSGGPNSPNGAVNYCHRCGHPRGGATFCTKCGAGSADDDKAST